MRPEDYAELQQTISSLTERVYKLERRLGIPPASSVEKTSISQVLPPIVQPAVRPSNPDPAFQKADLESAIGANWLNRIGIVAVLIGVSYFLKYAFDNSWIGPATRVVIGLAGGLGIVYWSEYFRRKAHTAFSTSLKAVGIGVLYLSLWASSQVYALVSPGIATFGMIAVTGFTIAMALLIDSEVIAGFAALGGFLTPLLLSTGENNAIALFSYIGLLDFGLLLLWRYRPWSRVAIGTFVGTAIHASAWYYEYYTPDQFFTAFMACSVFMVIFGTLPFVGRRTQSLGLNCLVLANAALYFLWIWNLLESVGHERVAALFAIGLAVLYFLASATALTPLYQSLGISFLIVAVPIGLEAQWITIGWLVEAAALLWASRETSRNYYTQLGAVSLGMGLLRLVLIDRFTVSRFLLNERMLVYAVAVVVLIIISKTIAADGRWKGLPILPALIVLTNVVALIALNLEIADFFDRQLRSVDTAAGRSLEIARGFTYSASWMSYGAALMFVGFRKNWPFFRWQALFLIALTILKVFLYDTVWLDRGYRILSFIALGFLLLSTSFFYQRDWLKLKAQR